MSDRYDVIIVGTGAGGGTLAYRLARTGKRILLLERGERLPRHCWTNRDPKFVFGEGRYRTSEVWHDGRGRKIRPGMHYCVGGNTKMFGGALVRLHHEDFLYQKQTFGESPAWPIDYATLEEYYDEAEDLYQVRGESDPTRGGDPSPSRRSKPYSAPPMPHLDHIAELAQAMARERLHPFHLPIGVGRTRDSECHICDRCDGYPCAMGDKCDAEVTAVDRALQYPNVELLTGVRVTRLEANMTGTEIVGVEGEVNGKRNGGDAPVEKTVRKWSAGNFVLACGAVNSAAILLRSNGSKRGGLTNRSGLVGCNYMAHHNAALVAFGFRKSVAGFQKTLALGDFYGPTKERNHGLGHAQLTGKVPTILMRMNGADHVPEFILRTIARRSVDWWLMTEDFPDPKNRVLLGQNDENPIVLEVQKTNSKAHKEFVRTMKRLLRRCGYPFSVDRQMGLGNCSHQLGTLRFGDDPQTSVLDEFCRSHDVPNLFVVDGSFFPSSGAMNPTLTIIAQALRVGEHMERLI